MFHEWQHFREGPTHRYYECIQCGQKRAVRVREGHSVVPNYDPDPLCQPTLQTHEETSMRAKLTQIAGLIALTILVGWAMAQLQGCGHTDTDQDSHVYCSLYPEDQTVDACHDSPQVAAKVACKEQDVDRYEPLYIAVCTPPVSTGERFDETSCDRLYWTGAMSRREVCETPTYE